MRKVRYIRWILPYAICIGFVLLTTFLHRQFDHRSGGGIDTDNLKYLPSGKFLKGAALTYDEVAADLLWIKAIGYFGEHAQTDQNYTWLYHILDITTTLDPFFSDPYEFGGIVLGTEVGDIDKSIEILKKGIENVPQHNKRYWYLPFFTAFNYMFYKGDNLTAAQYLETAAKYPQSPTYLPLLVARLYANTDDPGMALPFLEEMLAQTDSPELQESLTKRIKDIQTKQHIQFLSTVCNQFHERTGQYPKQLEELLNRGILQAIPVEPYGGRYHITEKCNVQTTSNVDTMELHIKPKERQPLILLQEQQ